MKKYCDTFDAYYMEDKWLERKCCTKPNDDCFFRCWERPDVPCVDCKYELECEGPEDQCE